MIRHSEVRDKALRDLQRLEVLMVDGHFDFGNGYHGPVYLNPHQLFRHPSTIWRFAQDLLDILPASLLDETEVVSGPVTGGALLAHTVAGLLDSRRQLTKPPTLFAPFNVDVGQSGPVPGVSGAGGPDRGSGFRRAECTLTLTRFYQRQVRDKRVLLVDDVRNTGQTLARCARLIEDGGGVVLATAVIYDRMETVEQLGVPNFALAEYRAPENWPADRCPLCRTGVPITTF